MDEQPVILLTNDDGVNAEGLNALRTSLCEIAQTIVVAPELEQSGSSHSITLNRPLRYRQHDANIFAVNGTPVDCVYVALFSDCFLPRLPDLVVSGINHGMNLGTDIFYSGTVGAAREASIRGIPSIALSYAGTENFADIADQSTRFILNFLSQIDQSNLSILLNVNFPDGIFKGARDTMPARRTYNDHVLKRKDPRGRQYLWIGGNAVETNNPKGTDTEAIHDGYISISCLGLESTDENYQYIAKRLADTDLS